LREKKSAWNSVCCRIIFESEENIKTFSKKKRGGGGDLLSINVKTCQKKFLSNNLI